MNHGVVSRRGLLKGAMAVTGIAAGGPLLAACSVEPKGGAAKGVTTITVMADSGEVSPEVIAAFEQANPDIKVTQIKNDPARLTAMLTAGDPPDVARGSAIGDAPYLVARQIAEPLDNWISQSKLVRKDELAAAHDLWRFDGLTQGRGQLYGLIKDYSQDAMVWVNTTLFEQAGVAVPDDTRPLAYEDLLGLAMKLTKRTADGKTAVYGFGGNAATALEQFSPMVALLGGRLFSEDFTKVDFSSPEAQTVLKFWADLSTANVSYNALNPNPEGWDGKTFLANRLAMFGQGYWFQGPLAGTAELAKSAKLLPAPTFGGKRMSPTYAATGLWIPKKAKSKEAAWRFLEFYAGGDPAKERAATGTGLPPLKSLESQLPQQSPQQQQAYQAQRRELAYFTAIPSSSPYVKNSALRQVFDAEWKSALSAKTPLGQLADKLNRQMNELIEQEKAKVK